MTTVATSSPVAQELMADAKGYGTLVALSCGQDLIHVERVDARVHRCADPSESDAFTHRLYCHVTATRRRRLYRAFDQFSPRTRDWAPAHRRHGMAGELRKSAFSRGSERGIWLAASRPFSAEIYRPWSAVKTEWRMDYLLPAELQPGTSFFVGRAAPQSDAGRRLHGGGYRDIRSGR
jgi:hypothetical protein